MQPGAGASVPRPPPPHPHHPQRHPPAPLSHALPAPAPARARPTRMNWNADVGARVARGTLLTARTLEPWRPHVHCAATPVACVVWSSTTAPRPPTTSPITYTLPAPPCPPQSAAGSSDLTTWSTLTVLPILRHIPAPTSPHQPDHPGNPNIPADAHGRPYLPQLFFPLHDHARGGAPGFGRLRTVPAWEAGEAWVHYPAWAEVTVRAHWDPLADCTATPVRLAFGESDRLLGYLRVWAGLPPHASEAELADKLLDIGEHARRARGNARLVLQSESPMPRDLLHGANLAQALQLDRELPSQLPLPLQHPPDSEPGFAVEREREPIPVQPLVNINTQPPITPPPAPATPITPSNADELATPARAARKRSTMIDLDDEPEDGITALVSPPHTAPPAQQPFSPVSIQLGPAAEVPDPQEAPDAPEAPEDQALAPVCVHCEVTSTPLWRTRKSTGEQLCNACAQYEVTHDGQYRPEHLLKKGSRKRNRWSSKSATRTPELRRSASASTSAPPSTSASASAATPSGRGRGGKRASLNRASASASGLPRKRSRTEKEEDALVQVKLEAAELGAGAEAEAEEMRVQRALEYRWKTWEWKGVDALGYAPAGFVDVHEAEESPERKRRKASFHVSRHKQFVIPKGAFGFLGAPYSPLSKLPTWLELIFSKADVSPLDTAYRIWPQEDEQTVRRTVDLLTSSSHTTRMHSQGRPLPVDASEEQPDGPGPPGSPSSTISTLPLTPLTQHSDEEFVFINEPPSPCLSSILNGSQASQRAAAMLSPAPSRASPLRQPLVAVAISFDLSQASWVPDRYTDNSPRRWKNNACWTQREPPGMWRERGEMDAWVREVRAAEPEDLSATADKAFGGTSRRRRKSMV
ncbi:hypothetical protein CALCODRAFT_520913 [Calocera cornea HHB12733]|uniref:GATA-type domain-containing protein n=1 Tax=Calocera cornea HHB12733 TaxID=1353952 RepID=A0A165D5U7_9BASI|nr:hypothetical protein CALCODRAFT_520913 [Calocera cornea HHB12733]